MLGVYLMFGLTALAGMLWLGGNLAACAALLAAALAGALLRLFCWGRRRPLSLCPIPLCLLLCLLAGQSAEGGTEDYAGRMKQIASRIDKGKLDEGEMLLEELDQEYGVTDFSRYAWAELYLARKEYENAQSCLAKVRDRASGDWYVYMERLYSRQGEAGMEKLMALYLSAAEDLPEDARMQYMAGLVRLEEGAYQAAQRLFRRARELDGKDGASCYYLGVISKEQGRQEEAAAYFAEALQCGVEEEKAAVIRWYTGGKENGEANGTE